MDWAKAKNTLIFLFIALNIFLAVNLFFNHEGDSVSKKNISTAIKILENRGYSLDCKIPIYKDSCMLSYEKGKIEKQKVIRELLGSINFDISKLKDGEKLKVNNRYLTFIGSDSFIYENDKPTENIDIANQTQVESYFKKFISGLNLPVSNYKIDTYIRNTDNSVSIVYRERLKDFLIIDSFVKATVTKNGISYLESKLINIIKLSSNSNKIIPVYQVLVKDFDKGNNSKITNIDIGFKDQSDGKLQTFENNPYWIIRVEGQEPRYFSTVDGQEWKL